MRSQRRSEEMRGPPPAGYYYSSSGSARAAPSPSHSANYYPSHHQPPPPQQHHLQNPRYGVNGGPSQLDMAPQPGTPRSRAGDFGPPPQRDDASPSYHVEHLATFAVGRSYGLVHASDGVRKLQDMERRSAIWAQPMVLRLKQNQVCVEDENGELVESFPMDLVEQPTAHVSNDPREQYNNILLFIVKEDKRKTRSSNPTEMHIFQCNRVAATEVAEDLNAYIRGQFARVRPGRRAAGGGAAGGAAAPYNNNFGVREGGGYPGGGGDDASIGSDGSEMFERDVNTLNRCFDDIERFVARIQAAAIAQRELEAQARRYRTAARKDKRSPPPPDPHGILHMRSRVPNEAEFVDVFRKFKLSFNLLAKLKNHIHEPNAPELLHFLFTPLSVILEACHWGLGRNIAPQVVSPLISLEARDLMQNCLTSKESDIWLSLGDAWRTTPEDWTGPLPAPYRPVFIDGFAPYGLPDSGPVPQQYSSSTLHHQQQPAPLHRGESAPPAHYRGRDDLPPPAPRGRSVDVGGVQSVPGTPATRRSGWSPSTPTTPRRSAPPPRHMSVDNVRDLDLDRINFERERVEFEKMMLEKEKRLLEEEKSIRAEKHRLDAERRMLHDEAERNSIASNRYNNSAAATIPSPRPPPMSNGHGPDHGQPDLGPPLPPSSSSAAPPQSPRERAFLEDMLSRRCKAVQVTYDRTSMNPKELSVHRGEYLEVLNDNKNWWECKNMHSRVGYVPHTILTVLTADAMERQLAGIDTYPQQGGAPSSSAWRGEGGATSPAGMNGHHHPQQQQSNHRNSQFIVVSEAGVQTNGHHGGPPAHTLPTPEHIKGQYIAASEGYSRSPSRRRSPSPPTRAPEPPAPPPIAGLQEAIDGLRRRPPAERPLNPKLDIRKRLPKVTPEGEALLNELNSTISRGEGRKILVSQRPPPTVQLSEKSSPDQVAKWMVEKGFSPRAIEILSDQDGAMLFSLSRNKLIEVCGREEGSRIYSQMLVQKKRSEYQTRTGAELRAILSHRKNNVEATNDAPSVEPILVPNGHA